MNHNTTGLPDGSDPLDAVLRETDDYIPDNGFTARVLQNLPARRSRRWSRFAVLSAALLIGMALAASQAPAMFGVFFATLKQPSLLNWQTVLAFAPLMAALASLVWMLVAVASGED
jgi:hypothetical protein